MRRRVAYLRKYHDATMMVNNTSEIQNGFTSKESI